MLTGFLSNVTQFFLSKLPSVDFDSIPGYNADGFWFHNNGILKGDTLYALWEECGSGINVYFYGNEPETAPKIFFREKKDAIAWLENR